MIDPMRYFSGELELTNKRLIESEAAFRELAEMDQQARRRVFELSGGLVMANNKIRSLENRIAELETILFAQTCASQESEAEESEETPDSEH